LSGTTDSTIVGYVEWDAGYSWLMPFAYNLCHCVVELEKFITEYLKKANDDVDRYNRSVKDTESRDLFD